MLRGGRRLAAMLGKRPRPPLCQEVLLCYTNDVSKLSRSLSRASSQTYGKGGGRTAGYTERWTSFDPRSTALRRGARP